MPTLAKSIFSRTPDETTVVADVYDVKAAGVVNSFQDLNISGFDLSDQFGFLSKFTSGNVLKSATDGALSLDVESVTDKISSAFSDTYSKAKSLVTDVVNGSASAIAAVKSDINGVTGLLRQASQVYATVNGIVQTVKTGNLSDLRSITNTLNAVSGRVGVALSANGALGGVFTSLVGEAGQAGIAGAFGVVADTIKASSDITNKSSMIYTVATGALPGAISRGDFASVASMASYIGNGSVSMLQPNAVSALARNDTASYTPAQIGGASGQFVAYQGAYQSIDPNWNTSSWIPVGSTTPIADLSALTNASAQVKSTFTLGATMAADNDPAKIYSVLPAIQPTTVDQEISARYPMALTGTSNIVSRDTDPRLSFESLFEPAPTIQ